MAQDSPSPATSLASISSDKENHDSRAQVEKGKGREPMAPPRLPSSSRNKRQRPSEREPNLERSRRRRTVEVADDDEDQDRSRRRQTVEAKEDEEPEYDPDQDIETRRELRKNLRSLGKDLTENRTEYLAPKSTGLKDSLNRANELSVQVKQTSDATIDSRFLVQAADLSYKKTVALTSGDNAQGVDIEEFIAKLKQFMRQGNGGENATQRRRANNVEEEDDEDIDGDMLDWEYLGRHACIKHTLRPSVPGFILGPLSLEKRAKRAVVRRAALKHKNMRETRPEVLQADDIEKDDEKMVTRLCGKITDIFMAYTETSRDAIEEAYDEDLPLLEQDKLLDKYGISRGDGGVSLFKFVINPKSFGQTVENMFYISFLIRDGELGITFDERGLPYLGTFLIPCSKIAADRPAVKKDKNAIRGGDAARSQAVLSLDMATWEDLIVAFDIKETIIPHRREDNHENAGQKGWYA